MARYTRLRPSDFRRSTKIFFTMSIHTIVVFTGRVRCLTGHRVSKALPLFGKIIALTRAEAVSKDEKAPTIADDCNGSCDRALLFLEQTHRRRVCLMKVS